MHIVFCTLNARFSHSSLALASLTASCQGTGTITIREYTINQAIHEILADLFLLQPDVLCFSCYIWNLEQTLRLSRDLKKISPRLKIILGGPEVSFAVYELMNNNPQIDFVVKGEGELVLKSILEHIEDPVPVTASDGICLRRGDFIYESPNLSLVPDLNILPRPAYEKLSNLNTRIIYYESSRGCPFNCAYCLSSTVPGIRYLPLSRVKEDLKYLLTIGAPQIKFVDRTFNSDEERARHIMCFLLSQPGNTKFHFEIRVELISDTFIEYLSEVPPGRFYFEIGIQSTCPQALQAVKRPASWNKAQKRIKQLREETSIQLHLDLIAGLPLEDINRFKQSFNQVFNLHPDVLQLGFLKMLKGTPLVASASKYGYAFQDHPPYQILKNDHLTYSDLALLQDMEELVERYYNSQAFKHALRFLIEKSYHGDAFAMFKALARFWRDREFYLRAHKRDDEYILLYEFVELNLPETAVSMREYLKYDYLLNQGSRHMPAAFKVDDSKIVNDMAYRLVKNEELILKYLPQLKDASPGERRRRIHLELFTINPLQNEASPSSVAILFVYPPGSPKAKTCFPIKDID